MRQRNEKIVEKVKANIVRVTKIELEVQKERRNRVETILK
jgi:hypothetical protein